MMSKANIPTPNDTDLFGGGDDPPFGNGDDPPHCESVLA